jgi:hypothetical protein
VFQKNLTNKVDPQSLTGFLFVDDAWVLGSDPYEWLKKIESKYPIEDQYMLIKMACSNKDNTKTIENAIFDNIKEPEMQRLSSGLEMLCEFVETFRRQQQKQA